MMLPTRTDFFASFFGILYAGAVPVPIYPPAAGADRGACAPPDRYPAQCGRAHADHGARGTRLARYCARMVETLEAVESVATFRNRRRGSPPNIRIPTQWR